MTGSVMYYFLHATFKMLESSVTLANGEVKIKNAARELSQLSGDSISSPAISESAASELDGGTEAIMPQCPQLITVNSSVREMTK
jgi:hypothetical protein